jgi:ribosome-associated protein
LRPASSWERVVECSRAALDRKAQELVVLATRELTSIADYFVICSGRSDTQVQAIADAVEQHLSQLGERPQHVEGREHGQWVLIDFGDVVVHVFNEPVRSFYDLERLWSRAPRTELPEPLSSQARGVVGATESA